jgi:DNA-binding response OmpR family regulator
MEKEAPATKIPILLAEDNVTLVEMFGTYLAQEGFEVFRAFDGEETLKVLREKSPKLVLLDLMMPKKSGFDVLAEMQTDANLKKIPVIVFSNLSQESDIKEARLLGAKDYLIKADLTPGEVLAKIKKILAA